MSLAKTGQDVPHSTHRVNDRHAFMSRKNFPFAAPALSPLAYLIKRYSSLQPAVLVKRILLFIARGHYNGCQRMLKFSLHHYQSLVAHGSDKKY